MPVEPEAGSESVEVEANPKPEAPKLVEAAKPAPAKDAGATKPSDKK